MGNNIFDFTDNKGYVHRIDLKTGEYGTLTPDKKVMSVFKVETKKEESAYDDAGTYLLDQMQKYGNSKK